MNALRKPTQAEHAAMQRLNAAYYATQQASRFDLRQRTPVFSCTAPARPADNDKPSRAMTWLTLIVASIAGMGIWAAVFYATWWAAGVYAAMQGAK